MWRKLFDVLPHSHNLAEEDWQRRHRILLWLLGAHVPALAVFGLALGDQPRTLALVLIAPVVAVIAGYLTRTHRTIAAVTVTGGLVYCSATLVGLSHGAIEAHFHFFILIWFIALYQDWAPFAFNIVFTVLSHGIGSAWQRNLIFEHVWGQTNPWLWSGIHGAAVLMACAAMVMFWRITDDSQYDKDVLARRLADAEINRRQFTSDLLTNLARRNQRLVHRQLEIINQLEDSEEDPDALSDLFALDHIATRVRRNAESLLVLSGEQPPRTWTAPVPLRDVLRAAIAETENLERVVFVVDEQSAVVGHTVTDLTHLLAELTENAVRFSPPDTTVTIRARPDRSRPGVRLITIEDWGLGMPAEQIDEANRLLATPPEIDLSISQRLGFHVVARLAARHGIKVALGITPGSGTTAMVTLPASLFAPLHPTTLGARGGRRAADAKPATQVIPVAAAPAPAPTPANAPERASWTGWWDPAIASALPAFDPAPAAVTGTAIGAVPAAPMPTYRTSTNTRTAPPNGVGPNPVAANGGGTSGHTNGHSNGHSNGATRHQSGTNGTTPNGAMPAAGAPTGGGPNGAATTNGNAWPHVSTPIGGDSANGTDRPSPGAPTSGTNGTGPIGRAVSGVPTNGTPATGGATNGATPGPGAPNGRAADGNGNGNGNGPAGPTLNGGGTNGSGPGPNGGAAEHNGQAYPVPHRATANGATAGNGALPGSGATPRNGTPDGITTEGPPPHGTPPHGIPVGGNGAEGGFDDGHGTGPAPRGGEQPNGEQPNGTQPNDTQRDSRQWDSTPWDSNQWESTPWDAPAGDDAAGGSARSRPSPRPRPGIGEAARVIAQAAPQIPTQMSLQTPTAAPATSPSGLRRRVPQSHLSAQLREREPEPAVASPRRTTAEAAAALSRYQASRAAAQAATGGRDTPNGDRT